MSDQLKKDTSWTIIECGTFGISGLKKEISKFNDEWLFDTSRQDKNVTHKNTHMYPLVYSDYSWQPGTKLDISVINTMKSISAREELNQIVDFLEKRFNGKLCRAEIVKMDPNIKIRKHVDGGSFLQYARRCHVSVITNENVFFTVLDNTVNMKSGRVYEINNSLPHSVENNSSEERVHIILDIMPLEMLQ